MDGVGMTLSGKGKTWLLVIFASAMVLFSYSASREIAHQLLSA
ncbi:putative C4-dicarboxylate transport sensor domain protein, partial [Vibrio parahaemolyticus V-223/04]